MIVATSTTAMWMAVVFYFSPGGDLVRVLTLPDAADTKAHCEQLRKTIPNKTTDGFNLSIRTVCLRPEQYPEFMQHVEKDLSKAMD